MAKRLPDHVYRRRRIVVLVAAIAVVALVWWGIAALVGGGGGAPSASPTVSVVETEATAAPEPSSASEPESTPEPTPTPTQPADCTSETVIVEAFTDAGSYAPDAQPQLSLRVTNAGESACVMDVGTATQVYTITSGSDQIWTSTDCQTDPTNEVVQLEAGQSLNAPAITWVRERSTPDTCDQERPAAVGGGASYSLVVSIGGVSSQPTGFVLE